MKLPVDAPSEQIMQYFTPELYVRFNSSDGEIADEADEAWEKALQGYQRHFEKIRNRMPSQVRAVAELCLHDADILGFQQEFQAVPSPEPASPVPFWSAVAVLSVKQDQSLRYLIYMLSDRIRECAPQGNWPFSKSRKHWRYDEFDLIDDHRGIFQHRILFSDGSTVEIPFVSAITSSVPWPEMGKGGKARQIA